MAIGQEKTSTSQVMRRRGPTRELPSASSLVSSLSMEELRSFFQIPDNISLEFLNSSTTLTVEEANSAVYFTREQFVTRLYFPASSLVKQFFHVSRAPFALIHPNAI